MRPRRCRGASGAPPPSSAIGDGAGAAARWTEPLGSGSIRSKRASVWVDPIREARRRMAIQQAGGPARLLRRDPDAPRAESPSGGAAPHRRFRTIGALRHTFGALRRFPVPTTIRIRVFEQVGGSTRNAESERLGCTSTRHRERKAVMSGHGLPRRTPMARWKRVGLSGPRAQGTGLVPRAPKRGCPTGPPPLPLWALTVRVRPVWSPA